MSADQATALFFGAALVLVLWFVLRRRARRWLVPSLAPFRHALVRRARPFWREVVALVLQVAVTALVCAALVEPQATPEARAEGRTIAVVDGSRSMGPRLEDVRSFLRARPELGIVLAEEGPLLLLGAGGSDAQRDAALARLRASAPRADLHRAVALVRALGAEPLVLSDAPADVGVVVTVLGPAAHDVALEGLDVSAGPGLPARLFVSVRIRNHDVEPTTRRLSLRTDRGPVGAVDVALEAGAESTEVFALEDMDGTWLEAALTTGDDAPHNDRSYAVLPRVRPARVALVGPPNRYLDRALAVLPELEVVRYAAGAEPTLDDVDLAIFDRATPRKALGVRSLHFAPPSGWTTGERTSHPKVIRWSVDHAVFEGVALRSLQIEEAAILSLPPGGQVLAATEQGPVIVADARGPGAVVFGFDLLRSDLPLTVAFPTLLYQAVVWGRSATVEAPAAPVREGEVVATDEPTIVERLDVPTIDLAVSEVRLDPGVYRLTSPDHTHLVAVQPNPDDHGSPFAGAPVETTDTEPMPPVGSGVSWLVVAALLLLVVELVVAPL